MELRGQSVGAGSSFCCVGSLGEPFLAPPPASAFWFLFCFIFFAVAVAAAVTHFIVGPASNSV